MSGDKLFRAADPVVPIRGVHLDLKGTPPTAERLVGLLDVFAVARYNAVLVEWEDTFPWTVDERFRCETAYTPEVVKRFAAAADDRGIEMIPLVQCLGHMQTPLSVPGYEHMREVPDRPDVLNPLAGGARPLVQDMVDDVLSLLPDVTHFHLGGDEAWSFGTHPDTKAHIEANGRGALYMHHVGPLLDSLNTRGIRPILWNDMMCGWEDAALDDIAGRADLMVWGYQPEVLDTGHASAEHMQRFADHGVAMWGAAAYKGADRFNGDLADFDVRLQNGRQWAAAAEQFDLKGVVATAWSRIHTHAFQFDPIEANLDCLVAVGAALHDGADSDVTREACEAFLNSVGEGPRFRACRDAMQRLTDLRARAWQAVQATREELTMMTDDPRRRASLPGTFCRGLQQAVADAEAVEKDALKAFDGLMPELWTRRYLNERLQPLRDELDEVTRRIGALT